MQFKNLFATPRYILSHPLGRRRPFAAIARYLGWQARSIVFPGLHVVSFAGTSKLAVARGMTGATGNIYCGLHECATMGLALHALREGDLFVDVGANVGAFTVLACEAGARCISLEPDPFARGALERNVRLNGFEDRVQILPLAAGSSRQNAYLTSDKGPANHIASEGQQIQIERLDDLVADAPTFIKIDVEGYEGPALEGAPRALARAQIVAVEVGHTDSLYGWTDADIHARLLADGFTHVDYDPVSRTLTPLSRLQPSENDALYVRNLSWAEERVRTARTFRVLGLPL